MVESLVKSVRVLGSDVQLVDLACIRRTLDAWVRSEDGVCRQMIVTGFHGLYRAHWDPVYRRIARGADLWVPDGIAPVALARLKGMRGVVRTPGQDIVRTFLRLAEEKGYSSYFYGDREEVLQKMRLKVEREYPRHRVAGTYSPPFRPLTEEEDREIVERINAARPDIVWVGLGMPKQDIWAYEHKGRLNAKAVIGVGAVFGFLAGTVRRCPDWIGNRGLEWLYRLCMEPRKLWRRDLIEGPCFLWHVMLEQLGIRKYE